MYMHIYTIELYSNLLITEIFFMCKKRIKYRKYASRELKIYFN